MLILLPLPRLLHSRSYVYRVEQAGTLTHLLHIVYTSAFAITTANITATTFSPQYLLHTRSYVYQVEQAGTHTPFTHLLSLVLLLILLLLLWFYNVFYILGRTSIRYCRQALTHTFYTSAFAVTTANITAAVFFLQRLVHTRSYVYRVEQATAQHWLDLLLQHCNLVSILVTV